MKNNKFFLWLLIGLVIMSLMQNFNKNEETSLNENDFGIATTKTEYGVGKEITLTLQNNTLETLSIHDACGDIPLEVLHYENSEWVVISSSYEESCESPDTVIEIAPEESKKLTYRNWSYRLFGETGRYRIDATLTIDGEKLTFASNEFIINERGFIGSLWLNGMYRPILNALVFLIEKLPNNSLGMALILLTLFIRTLLLVPSQRAMRSQKKMQELQPKLEKIKKKYKDNQELLAVETMKLWQTHKVNPFGSCLPLFIQFPILIALYYVVREGLHPDKIELLYDSVGEGFTFDLMQTNFLGILELTEINFLVLPLIVGGLQFIQMSLSLARAKKKQEAKKSVAKKVESTADMQSQMQMATNMMKYVMPVMIAFFTASLPAGVGLYWGISTTYGIVQQIVVNKESDSENEKNEPVVRVIEK